MPIVIILHESGPARIALKGESSGSEFTVDRLHVATAVSGVDYTLNVTSADSLTGQMTWLEQTGTPDEFRFRTDPPEEVTLAGEITATQSLSIFGRTIDVTGNGSATLAVKIPAGGPFDDAVTISICGKIEVAGSQFSTDAFCYSVKPGLSDLSALPRLDLSVPDIGLRLPSVSLPWSGLELPLPPYRLPAMSFDLQPLPVEVSFESLVVDVDTGTGVVTISITGLTIAGELLAIEADIELEIDGGDVTVTKLDIIRPDRIPVANLPEWKFQQDGSHACLMLAGSGSELNALFRVLTPVIDSAVFPSDLDWTIRFRHDLTKLEEVRLDIKTDADQTINLPGFEFTLDSENGSFLSLIFQAGKTLLCQTLPPAAEAKAELEFGWLRGPAGNPDRELIKADASAANTPRITVTASPQSEVLSLVVMKFNGRPEFFRKLTTRLTALDIGDLTTGCALTTIDPVAPVTNDFDFTFDATGFDDFKLPFLQNNDSVFGQFVSIKPKSRTVNLPTDVTQVFEITVTVGGFEFTGEITLVFKLKDFSFEVDHGKGIEIRLDKDEKGSIFGLNYDLKKSRDSAKADFLLITDKNDYALKQLPASQLVLSFDKATTDDTSIDFTVTDFTITSKGISLNAGFEEQAAKLNSLEQVFRFTKGRLEVNDNRVSGFEIKGDGALPPDLVGPSTAQIGLRFEQDQSGEIILQEGSASLETKNLRCERTRFQFALTKIGLQFVLEDGRYHLYFTLSGTAQYVPVPSDDAEGPLALMLGIRLDLVDCPLTTDVRVLARHIDFLIALPEKKTFPFLGCFDFELRAIGFAPQATVFGGAPLPAMRVSGQVLFDQDAGDAIDAAIDFHDLWIGHPKRGSFIPQLHLKGLGVKISAGSAFEIEGEANFLGEGTDLGGGVTGDGFTGRGGLQIKGLPKFTAGFAFLRVRRPGTDADYVRSWFLYFQAERFSLKIPVVEIFWREGGIGFGYRQTLAMIKSADELDDPRKLLARLKEQSKTQGELSRAEQWQVDLEQPGESPRWTIALRALFSQTSAAKTFTDWNKKKEAKLPCLFVVDAVAALRSDLTFLMVGRSWLWTNYHDFYHDAAAGDERGLKQHPLLTGFLLLSPRKKRFLANLSSHQDAKFGASSKLPAVIEEAVKSSKFSATLLIEPGLIHYELGWPNQLQWDGDLGPLQVQFRGGMIVRTSRTEFVIGQSFLARGRLEFGAGVDFGFVGARLSATADVAYGARYIGVIAYDDFKGRSALYGGAGIEINVNVKVDFWIEIDLLFGSITKSWNFNFDVNFTASVEVGILPPANIGLRGHATLGLNIMGHDLQFGIAIAWNDDAVAEALERTQEFLHVGLEAEEVESIPGTTQTQALTVRRDAERAVAERRDGGPGSMSRRVVTTREVSVEMQSARVGSTPVRVAVGQNADGSADVRSFSSLDELAASPFKATGFAAPTYSVMAESEPVADRTWLLLFPAGLRVDKNGVAHRETGFLPVPPEGDGSTVPVTRDFRTTWKGLPSGTALEQVWIPETRDAADPVFRDASGNTFEWFVEWAADILDQKFDNARTGTSEAYLVRHWIRSAFFCELDDSATRETATLDHVVALGDPIPLPEADRLVSDRRVHDPAESSFESAVRGAVEQFESSPYFKQSPEEYDVTLQQAFDARTTLYETNGRTESRHREERDGTTPGDLKSEEAHHMRGLIIRRLINDFKQIMDAVRAASSDDDLKKRLAGLAEKSLPIQMGLVFRCEGDAGWLLNPSDPENPSTIEQRNNTSSGHDLAGPKHITAVRTNGDSFASSPPDFTRVVQYAHEGSAAIDWRLTWSGRPSTAARQAAGRDNPEHHLDYYHIRRRRVDSDSRDREFKVRAADVLHRTIEPLTENDDSELEPKLVKLRPRFQFVDHFADEPEEDVKLLPAQGRRYVYTITPVDVAGHVSPQPLTVVVTRRPSTPPQTVADPELLVDYHLPVDVSQVGEAGASSDSPAGRTATLVSVNDVQLTWTPPVDNPSGPNIAIDGYRVLFRRHKVLPVGQYAQDGEIGGDRAHGGVVSNARPLRKDLRLEFNAEEGKDVSGPNQPQNSSDERRLKRKSIDLKKRIEEAFNKQGVPLLPESDREWQPEGWDVYVQTRSVNGVYSALTPVSVRLRFFRSDEVPVEQPGEPDQPVSAARSGTEERRPGLLEWLPRPVSLNLLPPRDIASDVGFALIPMPTLDAVEGPLPANGGWTGKVDFQAPPDRRRAIEFHWNQGPSLVKEATETRYPIELHAGYELYEFDTDAHLADELNKVGGTKKDFAEWAAAAKLRLAQQFELATPDTLLTSPSDTSDTQRWEAWYPSAHRRMKLHRDNITNENANDTRRESPWYSWCESWLEWPQNAGMDIGGPLPLELFRGISPTEQADLRFAEIPIDSPRQRERHAFLDWLILRTAIDLHESRTGSAGPRYRIEYGAVPWRDADEPKSRSLAKFLEDTAEEADPYGWRLLQQTGLATCVTFRDPATSEAVEGDVVVQAMAVAVEEFRDKANAQQKKWLNHLHLDLLFRPTQATLLEETEQAAQQGGGPAKADGRQLLGLVQLSLRPHTRRYARYWQSKEVAIPAEVAAADTASASSGNEPDRSAQRRTLVEVVVRYGSGLATPMLISVPDDAEASVQRVEEDGGKASVTLSAQGRSAVLLRSLSKAEIVSDPNSTPAANEIDIHLAWPTAAPQPVTTAVEFHPIDATKEQTRHFVWESKDVTGKLDENAADGGPRTSWQRLKQYVDGITAGAPDGHSVTFPSAQQMHDADHRQGKPSIPTVDILRWLNRFFLHGAVPDDTGGEVDTGYWLATGWYRGAGPIAVHPDPETGVLRHFHLIADEYAHAWRYLIRPLNRYDRLWQSLAGSRELVADSDGKPDNCQIVKNLEWLRNFATPDPGGLDVVVDRIRPVEPPKILFSGRIDLPDEDPNNPVKQPPGRTWQVAIAKHAEQTLSESNRTVARRLQYWQVSTSLIRRFSAEVSQLKKENPTDAGLALAEWYASASTGPLASDDPFHPEEGDVELAATDVDDNLLISATFTAGDRTPAKLAEEAISKLTDNAGNPVKSRVDSVGDKVVLSVQVVNAVQVALKLKPVSSGTAEETIVDQPVTSFTRPLVSKALPQPPGPPTTPTPLVKADIDPNDETKKLRRRELLLGGRLGEFGTAATVYEWQGLPFYYQHRLLAIAQSTNVVSPVTSVTQQDFEYVSPPAVAFMRAGEDNTTGDRFRDIKIRLGNFFDALPAAAKQQWPDEDPTNAWLDPQNPTREEGLPVSALPDPAVIYQLVVKRPGNIVQALAQFAFEPGQTGGYSVLNFPAQLSGRSYRATVEGRSDWGNSSHHPWQVNLETRLHASSTWLHSSVHDIGDVSSISLAVVNGSEPPALVLNGRITEAELTQIEALFESNDDGTPRDAAILAASQSLSAMVRDAGFDVQHNIVVPVAVGLDQLIELVSDPNQVSADLTTRELTIVGGLTPRAEKNVESWLAGSPSQATFAAVLAGEIVHAVTRATGDPDSPTSGPLEDHLKIEPSDAPGRIVWTGRSATDDQKSALKALAENTDFSASFRDAIGQLRDDLASATIRARIREDGWQGRPSMDAFDGISVADRCGYVRARVSAESNQTSRGLLVAALRTGVSRSLNEILLGSAITHTCSDALTSVHDIGDISSVPLASLNDKHAPALVLIGRISEDELAAVETLLRKTNGRLRDAAMLVAADSFSQRVRAGGDGFTREHNLRIPLSVGLDQLVELVDDPNNVSIDVVKREVVWVGGITTSQRDIIVSWQTTSPSHATFTALLSEEVHHAFDRESGDPDIPTTGPLVGRLTMESGDSGDQVVWTGRDLSDDERAALQVFIDDMSLSQSFRDAIQAVITDIDADTLRVRIREDDWQGRPSVDDFESLGSGLEQRVTYARAQLSFGDLMLDGEREDLVKELTAAKPINTKLINALYTQTLDSGFGGATLQIRAIRGSAKPTSDSIRTQVENNTP